MRGGSERGEAVDAAQRRKTQRLQAAPQRRRAMRHQGTVVARMRVRMRRYGLGARGHHRTKGLVLVQPMGKQGHADTRQTGRHLDERPLRRRFFFASRLGVAALSLD